MILNYNLLVLGLIAIILLLVVISVLMDVFFVVDPITTAYIPIVLVVLVQFLGV